MDRLDCVRDELLEIRSRACTYTFWLRYVRCFAKSRTVTFFELGARFEHVAPRAHTGDDDRFRDDDDGDGDDVSDTTPKSTSQQQRSRASARARALRIAPHFRTRSTPEGCQSSPTGEVGLQLTKGYQ